MRHYNRKSKIIAEINIAPFTDVILVLLIIFMVTTPLIYRSSININLPKVVEKTPVVESKDINVYISSSGEVIIEDQKYNVRRDGELMKFKLKQILAKMKDPALIINGDKDVKYDYVVQVVNMATKLGINQLVLATEIKQ
jgi:biopolymer transport protein ExbD